ncbi:NAD-dependent epimerase/dehydratase family protein [Streptomyces yunnanensis]|uniref:NAD-dependent epimerase/dehydratase family protein n=1 Tax=Streptomyces yunnanensis TaxID=156453 RepID=A0ABY8A6L6_9ACTN|nr:NAD-dependent epimerase/dehydratase family protein [Streptomyces yunnanensis]WEB39555.1 NAD-dependent epimerase/dehydratase family protein [Streptomyces yunnanensis]
MTGATGLVGAQVVRSLLGAGHEVRAVVRRSSDTRQLRALDVCVVDADLRVPVTLRPAFEDCEAVFHCAAVFAYWDVTREDLARANVEGTREVLRAAAAAGVRRVVVTSSSVTCGSSDGPVSRDENGMPGEEYLPDYFLTKLEQERAALAMGTELGVEVVAACPTIVVGGPDWRLVPSNALLTRYLADPLRTSYPGGCNIVSVRDVADGHLLLAEQGTAGERYLLGGENWAWRTIHQTVSELCGTHGPWATTSHAGAYVAATLAEIRAVLSARTPSTTRAEARTMGRYYWYEHAKAAALGYTPRPARQALAEALGWLVTSPHVPDRIRSGLRPHPEVMAARELVPRQLDEDVRALS